MCIHCDRGLDVEALMDTVQTNIAKFGWTVIGVEDSQFCYTVGLTKRGWPELVVRRLSEKSGMMLLNTIAQMCVDDGEPPRAGLSLTVPAPEGAQYSTLRALPVELRRYPYRGELSAANRLYGRNYRTALEVVPDHSGPAVVK